MMKGEGMLDLKEEFQSIVKLDEEIKREGENYLESIERRDIKFNEVVSSLNNYREMLREELGIEHYNYSKVCNLEDGDNMEKREYCFKVIFNNSPSAKELELIEQITGCKLGGQLRNKEGYYFALPKSISYSLPNSLRG